MPTQNLRSKITSDNKGKRTTRVPERFRSYFGNSKSRFNPQKRSEKSVADQSFFSAQTSSVTQAKLSSLGIQNFAAKNYIPSPFDRTDLISIKPVALLAESNGQGLFAKQEIPQGTCIGVYTGTLYSANQFAQYLEQSPGADKSYAMEIAGQWIDAANKGNFTRYINFSDTQANVAFIQATINQQLVVKVVALKTIPQGQQILVDYNTYDPRATKDYFFMNPEDNENDAYSIYCSFSNHYTLKNITKTINPLRLLESQEIVLTDIIEGILNQSHLDRLSIQDDEEKADLPCILVNADGSINEFNQKDILTPLMLACYFGQLTNVIWLINRKANIDRQQNTSGNCPLFFALTGYYSASNKSKYFQVMEYLIDHNVNVTVHDREDKTFLHRALPVLSNEHFKALLTRLKTRSLEEFNALYDYLDQNDEDVVINCIRLKDFDKLMILIELNPRYFYINFTQKRKQDTELFIKSISDYPAQDKAYLFSLLRHDEIELGKVLVKQLSDESESGYSI